MTASALREDISSAVSMLFFVPNQEQVVLNHLEKTYGPAAGQVELLQYTFRRQACDPLTQSTTASTAAPVPALFNRM